MNLRKVRVKSRLKLKSAAKTMAGGGGDVLTSCLRMRPGRISIYCNPPILLLAPGFSRVNSGWRKWERFQPFSAPGATKPLKRLGAASPAPTGLKPGANE
jgi:hypothetical protein